MSNLNVEAIKALLAKRTSSSKNEEKEDLPFWFFPKGTEKVILRFLPKFDHEPYPGMLIRKHYNIPEIGSMLCLETHGMECPICNEIQKVEHKLDTKKYKAIERCALNALVLQDPSNPKIDPTQPHIVMGTETQLYWLVEKLIHPEYGDITDAKAGHSVEIFRKKEGGAFERNILPKQKPIAATEGEIESILAKRHDLSKIWRKPDDNFITNKVIPASKSIKKMLEEMVQTLSNLQNGAVVESDTPNTAPKIEVSAIAPNQNFKKPSGAPDCFADKSVYYMNTKTGQPDPSKRECLSCEYDFNCSEAIRKLGN